MKEITLVDLQTSVRDTSAFNRLQDYYQLCKAFLVLMQKMQPTRIISPTHNNYMFYQYNEDYGYRITRPLNTNLFIESENEFNTAFQRFMSFLADLKQHQDAILNQEGARGYIETAEINRVVYTVQQSIGSIGDSFENPNQSRKRVGQLFEVLVKLIIQEVGLECEPRTISIPIPGYPGYEMSYELDLVFSRNKAIVAAETRFIHETEIVGSVKTTSKDRIDKVFLDKYLLTKLLGREVPVIAVFLHDVQRAKAGNSIFGINSTFKSNHFLGYTVALNRLDGVYYVDPRPEMLANARLREQIKDFQTFLVQDLWRLSVR
ncbi:hypothetical protein [Chloroflexus aggregans]|uniref:Uncharacterized protein n=1 Tax=Chloroflexus aggregans (strain MD-66 / DSM 9485) TaxID=326427 RepID=B8GD55_CHLAD|nr:hypothetical protein [Chloroflexus aggregans]ACL25122.1 conserved hypothetical protein [Chloroflexus aggregans DSM 9485]